MKMSDKRIVEIDGIKMEVDFRTATTVAIDTFKVGDHVKLLVPAYNNSFKAHIGAIIGFDDFKQMPTIAVAYLEMEYSRAEVKIAYVHEGSKYELTHASDGDVPFSKKQIIDLLDRDIVAKEQALEQSKWHRQRFDEWFGRYFEASQATEPAVAD